MVKSICFLTILSSYLLYINANVVLYEYAPNSHIVTPYNGIILRETIQSAYFAYKYHGKIQLPLNAQQREYPKSTLLFGSNLHKDYIVRDTPIKIGSIQYNSTERHIFHYVLNLVVSFKNNFGLLITHNGENIKQSINNRPISIYEFREFSPGYHIIDVYISSNKIACSCPSRGNGYINSRYFVGWVESHSYSSPHIMDKLTCNTGIIQSLVMAYNRNYPNPLSI